MLQKCTVVKKMKREIHQKSLQYLIHDQQLKELPTRQEHRHQEQSF